MYVTAVNILYKTISGFLTAFSLFAFHSRGFSACQSCISSILAVHGGELSGHGSISLYIHITHVALRVMRTDVVDQQNIVVEPKYGLKTCIT